MSPNASLVISKQRNVRFVLCPSPVTIDKSAAWGPGNMQQGPNGAFLKVNGPTASANNALEISHLVQPNADVSAPLGWVKGDDDGLFHKAPIWVDAEVLQPGTKKQVNTADGPLEYEIEVPSRVCYNDLDGAPNENDAWVQTEAALTKNYEFTANS